MPCECEIYNICYKNRPDLAGQVLLLVILDLTSSTGLVFYNSQFRTWILCYFGKPRQSGSSHCVYKAPWLGDPRVNIQNSKGKAKPYQVKQVLLAIEQIEVKNGS
ncbi:toxin [Bathymodiolus platifrons methanotrophic gill symbiont]|nr:toxin [Bathymodiolus platifrons methanotrophic gill symbiont]